MRTASGSPSAGAIVVERGYFGPIARPLFGQLHRPTGAVAGGVVLCAPLGYEYVCAYETYRLLADELAGRGIAALRFDYDGTGDSAGEPTDPDRVGAWVASVGAAVAFLNDQGIADVGLVGLRFGATLAWLHAATTARRCSIVAWDPVASGRRYSRELQLMRLLDSAPEQVAGTADISVVGVRYTTETMDAIKRVDLRKIRPPEKTRLLLLSRPDRTDTAEFAAQLQAEGADIDVLSAEETARLLDTTAEGAVVPERLIADVAEWLVRDAALELSPSPTWTGLRSKATLSTATDVQIEEEVLSVPPVGLVGVLTSPTSGGSKRAVILLNNGVAPHTGPARAWVDFARYWAGLGTATVRLDLSGLGDSPHREGRPRGAQYPIEAIDDVGDTIRLLGERGFTELVAGGLCSGAFLSLDIASHHREVTAVIPINPQLWHVPADRPRAARRRASSRSWWPIRVLLDTRVGRKLSQFVPMPAWVTFDTVGAYPVPTRGLQKVVESGVEVVVVFGDHDPALWQLRKRSPRRLRRLSAASNYRFIVVPGMDHSFFGPGYRAAIRDLLTSYLSGGLGAVDTATRVGEDGVLICDVDSAVAVASPMP